MKCLATNRDVKFAATLSENEERIALEVAQEGLHPDVFDMTVKQAVKVATDILTATGVEFSIGK